MQISALFHGCIISQVAIYYGYSHEIMQHMKLGSTLYLRLRNNI